MEQKAPTKPSPAKSVAVDVRRKLTTPGNANNSNPNNVPLVADKITPALSIILSFVEEHTHLAKLPNLWIT
ncbi:MAG: hypothetical protein Q8O32_02885 [bacterium]|nr:hypothetical protein [bacterium]